MIVILYILDNIEVTHLKSLKKEDVLDFYKVDVIKLYVKLQTMQTDCL